MFRNKTWRGSAYGIRHECVGTLVLVRVEMIKTGHLITCLACIAMHIGNAVTQAVGQ